MPADVTPYSPKRSAETFVIAATFAHVTANPRRSRRLQECCVVPDLFEEFHAISVARRYQPPLLRALLARRSADMLRGGGSRRCGDLCQAPVGAW